MRLKEIRNIKGISQKELGDKLGVARNTISGYENGVAEPNIENIIKLADILEVSVDTLLGHDTNIVDLNVLNKNQKILIEKIVKFLTDDEISKILGYVDSFKK
ncbi:MAG: helix-turn-helix transcriptional regulator [Clostridia bacterium]|nr:helix-turn-helix transcriptional regulator [Clostridia bacterium]